MSKVAARLKNVKAPAQSKIGGRYDCHIPAGKATGGPPLGTALGKLGVNIPAFVKDFNDKTKHLKEGIPVGCEVDVNPDRSYQMVLSTPPFTYYLFQAAGITRGSWEKGQVAGKITLKHCYEIAKIKQGDFYMSHRSLQEITEIIVRKAFLMGITVQREPLDPKEYAEFLTERKAAVAQRDEEINKIIQDRLLRLTS